MSTETLETLGTVEAAATMPAIQTHAAPRTFETTTTIASNHANYSPAALLDHLIATMRLANDRALAAKMNMRPSLIAKLREGRIAISGSILLWMHQTSGLTMAQLRSVLGDQRAKLRFNC